MTGTIIWLILMAVIGSFGAAWFAIDYTSKSMPDIIYYITGIIFLAFIFEVLLRLVNDRAIQKQVIIELEDLEKRVFNRY